MSNYIFPRRMLYKRQNLEKLFYGQRHTSCRNVTSTITADKYEDPALATAKPFNEIPKLPMVPFLGSSWVYFPIIGKYTVQRLHLADFHKNKVYGDIVREKIGHLDIVNSYTADTLELFFKEEGPFPNRGEFSTLKAYRESRKQWYKSTGVMVLNGEEWQDMRKKTQKHLMKPRTIQAYLKPMQEVARDLVSLMQLQRDASSEVPQFLEKLYKWALESVAYVGLDTRLGCLSPHLAPGSDGLKLIESVQTQFECMSKLEALVGNFQFWKYIPSPTWKRFEKASDVFTEIAFKYINLSLANLKRRNPDDDKDLTLLESMLMTKGLDASRAMVMVADMLTAGIDTTSHTVGYLLYTLAKNPDKQEKLFQEIRECLPRKDDKITPNIFNQLHYLKACLKESIRLHPINRINARSFDHDVVINGYRVPAGTVIFALVQVIYRNEKYFKNADKFFPERWLNKEDKPESPFAFVPFGIGVRACIGRRLAELEMICLAVEIIRNFKVEYHHEDLGMITRLVSTPDKPLRFTFLDR